MTAADRPESVDLTRLSDGLRVATIIRNEPECHTCHGTKAAALGVLLLDVSMANYDVHFRDHILGDLAWVGGTTVAVALLVYFLINKLVVRPVEAFRRPLAAFVAGEYAPRLPVPTHSMDELGQLALAFNHMAGELDRHVREQTQWFELRQQLVAEERNRIAQNLHDGLAQLLGYVNTKAMAIRLLLKQNKFEAADTQLYQLEEAARELSTDVRTTIQDLKTVAEPGVDFPDALEALVKRFNRLNEITVQLRVDPRVRDLCLAVEVERQLVSIVQESLNNVRKHSLASNAAVSVQVVDGALALVVSDNGRGITQEPTDRGKHYGLRIMQERAAAINARFDLESAPGQGTRTSLHLLLDGKEQDARIGGR